MAFLPSGGEGAAGVGLLSRIRTPNPPQGSSLRGDGNSNVISGNSGSDRSRITIFVAPKATTLWWICVPETKWNLVGKMDFLRDGRITMIPYLRRTWQVAENVISHRAASSIP